MGVQRKAGLDIIRTVAIFAIMLIHMLGHTGVLGVNLRSATWTGYVFLRYTVRAGVPLFLMLTGYLQSKRNFDKKHYTSIIPVMVSYFVISIMCAVSEYISEGSSAYSLFIKIFDYEYGYGWYVEMYIGLFLLIPFLNILYRTIDKTKKLWLVGILSFLTFLPSALQYATVNGMGLEILPDFFKNLYPFAFYFIGSYIAEYKPEPNKILCGVIAFGVLAAETVSCYLFSAQAHAWWLFNNEASLTHAVVAVCIFLVFYNIDAPKLVALPVKLISACSFEMYLVSYITDILCYRYLHFPIWQIVIVDFVFAFAMANLIRWITKPVNAGLRKIFK